MKKGKPAKPSSSMFFQNAKDNQFHGTSHFVAHEHKHYHGSGSEALDEGIRLLVARVVKGAMHNSEERFDAPTCHKETRIALQEDVLGWADEIVKDFNQLVTWMYGPAGSGKSAIAQTIAQKLDARGQLAASFFFSRASGSEGRGTEIDFVATLAHQLCQTNPATEPHIAAAVRKNPRVFGLTLKDQVNRLIVAPLIAVSTSSSEPSRPSVIVVDGLDECRKEHDAQRRIVDALISGLCQIPHHTLKLFITSRPEHNIVTIFNRHSETLLRRMELNYKWNPDDDIRTFLNASFADIRRSHFYFRRRPVDERWPESSAIDTLVNKSSGQFIYASIVLKYIKSDENYDPVARLTTILDLNNNKDQPYAELDALYKHVFSQIRGTDRDRVLVILSFNQECPKMGFFTPDAVSIFLSEFMGMHMDGIKFCLLPLVSLLVWDDGRDRIRYMHASLLDFLQDQSRSDIFCINSPTIAAGIVRRAIEMIEDGTALKASPNGISSSLFQTPTSLCFSIAIPRHYADMLPLPDQRYHIYSIVSNFNVVDTLLYKIDVDFVRAGLPYLDMNASHYFSNSAAQVQTWFANQSNRLRLDGLDNTKQIDLRPFVVTARIGSEISEYFSSALEICRSSPICHPLQRGMKINLSRQTAVLCHLMSHSMRTRWGPPTEGVWFRRSDLLGGYAMTRDNYAEALQCTAYYLLQLPKRTLLGIFNGTDAKETILETPVMHLIREVLATFLVESPATPELYFLVALTEPIMRIMNMPYHHPFKWDLYPKMHVISACVKLPYLQYQTSSGYILARATVQESFKDLKVKTSLHEVVETRGVQMFRDGLGLAEYKGLLAQFPSIDRRIPESA
ncbi:hypothetical protein D9619_013744 [Psilocybe cf. subviscida]|uniref:NACHT domain-containing protein n=1 Tax=Psilocybe cf. subviscida TaxID=2480587 RepID=A0A8H5AYV2_9AGAR|nr:hypothetical protein D9619_013744 [Psilocybe cf. subviscida]